MTLLGRRKSGSALDAAEMVTIKNRRWGLPASIRREHTMNLSGGGAMAVVCPECDSAVAVEEEELEKGETLECDECGASLKVTSVDPVELTSLDESSYDDEDGPPTRAAEEE
jgi:alpha-aminoadipate carrier protein LysW